jgi:pimeloyl-ACP methyl ester carboxylesterase
MRRVLSFRAALFSILFLVCSGSVAWTEATSKYIRNENADTVIIFIHGVFGDADSTWTNGATYWPKLLTTDHTFDGVDIFVLSYPTTAWSTTNINELAAMAQLTLSGMEVTKRAKLIFVAHSMGGLILREYLLTDRDVAARTKFAFFFSTPTEGAQVAALASFILTSPQIAGMSPIKSTDDLANTIRNWINSGLKVTSYCAYETEATFGKMIVSFASAANLCTERIYPIGAKNHMNIVKPANTGDLSYLALKTAFIDRLGKSGALEDPATLKQYARVLRDINATLMRSKEELIPQIDVFVEHPTEEGWRRVRITSAGLLSEINEGVKRSMDFDAQFFEAGNKVILISNGARKQTVDREFNFRGVRQEWNGRAFVLHEIEDKRLPTKDEATQWRIELQSRYDALSKELAKLIALVESKT